MDRVTNFVVVYMDRIVEYIIAAMEDKKLDIPTFLLLEGLDEEDSRLDIGMIVKEEVATGFADEHAYF